MIAIAAPTATAMTRFKSTMVAITLNAIAPSIRFSLFFSHEKILTGKISDFSSELSGESSVHNLVKEEGIWSTGKNDDNKMEFFVLDLGTVKLIDFIELLPSGKDASAFPRDFRIELSINGEFWKVIHTERSFSLEGDNYTLDIPLNRMRYLRLLITDHHKNNNKY